MSQTVTNRPGDLFFGAVPSRRTDLSFSPHPKGQVSSQYHIYRGEGGKFNVRAYGALPSLDDTDDVTIPDIYKKIMAALDGMNEREMKPYTNTIPGTTVSYVMLPIPGGRISDGQP